MPGRLLQIGLRNTVAATVRLSVGALVVTIINLIGIGGVLLVHAPLAGWAA